MKLIVANLVLLVSLCGYAQLKITPEDLKMAIGSWEGSITYLDYQTGKPFTMTANVIVEQGRDKNSLVLKNIYPNEPKANNSERIKASKNGMFLNKSVVTSREEQENGRIQIQTEDEGKDNNKRALIRYTYILGTDVFLIRKEVQFEPSGEWIKRSEFNYQKKK